MSTASNNHGKDRDRTTKPAERPSTTYAEADQQASVTRTGDAAKAPPAAPAIAVAVEHPAREDQDAVSFQRNAIRARLSPEDRARITAKLG